MFFCFRAIANSSPSKWNKPRSKPLLALFMPDQIVNKAIPYMKGIHYCASDCHHKLYHFSWGLNESLFVLVCSAQRYGWTLVFSSFVTFARAMRSLRSRRVRYTTYLQFNKNANVKITFLRDQSHLLCNYYMESY